MKATKCPVCEGTGKYEEKTCHGCDGKGWVSVSEDYSPYPIPYDPYKHYPTYPRYIWGDDPLYYYPVTCDDHTTSVT